MENNRCCVCGKSNPTAKRSYHGKRLPVCDECNQAFKWIDSIGNKEVGMEYLREKLANETASSDGVLLIKNYLHEEITQEEFNAARVTSEANSAYGNSNSPYNVTNSSYNNTSSPKSKSGSSAMIVIGICFLLASGILYYISIDNKYGVANVQATVFSAANFVAAIVCFVAGRIIKTINSK